MLGTQTWGGRVEVADESTELWRHPKGQSLFATITTTQQQQQQRELQFSR